MKGTIHLKDYATASDATQGLVDALKDACDSGKPLVIGRGVWKTGPIDISRPCEIILEDGAVLSLMDDIRLYRPSPVRWEGVDCYGFHPCIQIHDTSGVSISGSGRIDGNGQWWWERALERKDISCRPESEEEKLLASLNPGYEKMEGGGGGRESQFLRPDLFQVYRAKDIKISGIGLQNSPFWTLHPVLTSNLLIEGVSVENPYDSPNTDGINIDSCDHVVVRDCLVDVGDDGISMKSGCGDAAIMANSPTHDVLVSGCTVRHAHGGFVIGSDSSGGVHDIKVEKCRFLGTDRGIRIKTRRGRGGDVHSVDIRDIEMDSCITAITMNMYYRCGAYRAEDFSRGHQEVSSRTPAIHDIRISGIRAENCRGLLAFIAGLPESPITGVEIADSTLSLAKDGLVDPSLGELTEGLEASPCRGIRIMNGQLTLKNSHLSHDLMLEEGGRADII